MTFFLKIFPMFKVSINMYDEVLVKKKLILSKITETPGGFTKVGVTAEMKYKYRLYKSPIS